METGPDSSIIPVMIWDLWNGLESGLFFNPLCSKEETVPYKLHVFKAVKEAKFIEVNCPPIGQALDRRSLLQFPNLTCLRLSGNLVHLEALAELKKQRLQQKHTKPV